MGTRSSKAGLLKIADTGLLSFIKKYNFQHIRTLIRGTLRYEGYAFIMRSLCRIGLFLKEPVKDYVGQETSTWPALIEGLLAKCGAEETVE